MSKKGLIEGAFVGMAILGIDILLNGIDKALDRDSLALAGAMTIVVGLIVASNPSPKKLS